MRSSFSLLFCVSVLAALGCQNEVPKLPPSPQSGAPATVLTRLQQADALDGEEDKVVHRCYVCALGMDGKAEHSARKRPGISRHNDGDSKEEQRLTLIAPRLVRKRRINEECSAPCSDFSHYCIWSSCLSIVAICDEVLEASVLNDLCLPLAPCGRGGRGVRGCGLRVHVRISFLIELQLPRCVSSIFVPRSSQLLNPFLRDTARYMRNNAIPSRCCSSAVTPHPQPPPRRTCSISHKGRGEPDWNI